MKQENFIQTLKNLKEKAKKEGIDLSFGDYRTDECKRFQADYKGLLLKFNQKITRNINHSSIINGITKDFRDASIVTGIVDSSNLPINYLLVNKEEDSQEKTPSLLQSYINHQEVYKKVFKFLMDFVPSINENLILKDDLDKLIQKNKEDIDDSLSELKNANEKIKRQILDLYDQEVFEDEIIIKDREENYRQKIISGDISISLSIKDIYLNNKMIIQEADKNSKQIEEWKQRTFLLVNTLIGNSPNHP